MVKIDCFNGDEVVTVREIADTLKVTYLTAYKWVHHGKIPGFKIGRLVRVKRVDFENWLKEVKVKPE